MTMLLIVVCLTLLICELATLCYYRKSRFKETNDFHEITDFEKKIDNTGLIYIPFTCNGKELNFLLDTGSTISYIDTSVAKTLGCELKECNESAIGFGGGQTIDRYCELKLETPTTITLIELPLGDFEHAFNRLKEECNIEIHGLLGNNFLQASKYIIDYKKMKIFKPKQ